MRLLFPIDVRHDRDADAEIAPFTSWSGTFVSNFVAAKIVDLCRGSFAMKKLILLAALSFVLAALSFGLGTVAILLIVGRAI
jgi:hypothetical protein